MSPATRFSTLLIALYVLPGLAYAGSGGLAAKCHMALLDERVIAQFLGSSPDNTAEALIEIAKSQEFPEDRMAKVMQLIAEAQAQKDLGEWVRSKMNDCMLKHHQ